MDQVIIDTEGDVFLTLSSLNTNTKITSLVNMNIKNMFYSEIKDTTVQFFVNDFGTELYTFPTKYWYSNTLASDGTDHLGMAYKKLRQVDLKYDFILYSNFT